MFVLDCSMTMAWLFEDEKSDLSEKVLESLNSKTAIVPPLWIYEVTNVLIVAERRNRISHAQTVFFLEILNSFPIEIENSTPFSMAENLLSIAREFKLSTYDAAYLHLALHKSVPLATLDPQLIEAAKATKVELIK